MSDRGRRGKYSSEKERKKDNKERGIFKMEEKKIQEGVYREKA